jgi:hypothetical protein
MVVIRYTWHVPGPNFQEVRKLFTEIGPPESSALRAGRGYQSRTGLTNTLALEWEFESLAKWEAFLPQFFALPENADKFRRWNELVSGSATVEVWDLLGTV